MFRSMKLMMDALGIAVGSGQGHQRRHRHGATQQGSVGYTEGGMAAQDFYIVVPNRP